MPKFKAATRNCNILLILAVCSKQHFLRTKTKQCKPRSVVSTPHCSFFPWLWDSSIHPYHCAINMNRSKPSIWLSGMCPVKVHKCGQFVTGSCIVCNINSWLWNVQVMLLLNSLVAFIKYTRKIVCVFYS